MCIDAIIRRMNNTEDQVNVTKTKGSNGFVTFLITIYSSVTHKVFRLLKHKISSFLHTCAFLYLCACKISENTYLGSASGLS